ncbi:glycosyltransferase [Weissella cibaria]|uniref:glycosyltransferase n=1 Tax=Weissella cibaria TaxID=137591 RepID=UPI00223BCB3B|nr:glycosyltransferase [Weissella cibaria]MCT0020011.1 glycosyltransferase [Weissella cibaria]
MLNEVNNVFHGPGSKEINEILDHVKLQNTSENISVGYAILTHDNESSVIRLINSIIEFGLPSEIIVVDTGSKDSTLELLNTLQNSNRIIQTYQIKWNNDFSSARNFAIGKIKSDWTIVMDSDEWIVNQDFNIKKALYASDIAGYSILSGTIIEESDNYKMLGIPRIFKTGKFRYTGLIHEYLINIETNYPEETIPELNLITYHDGYSNFSVKKFDKLNRNITLIQKMRKMDPYNARWVYFLSREILADGQYNNSEKLLLRLLTDTGLNFQKDYISKGWFLLAKNYYLTGNFKKLHDILPKLKSYINLTDYTYFETVLKMLDIQNEINIVIKTLREVRRLTTSDLSTSELNTDGEHLDFLIEISLLKGGHITLFEKYASLLENGYFDPISAGLVIGENYQNMLNRSYTKAH